MKRCCKCGEWKELDAFGKLTKSKDGYRYDCKECRKKFWFENRERLIKIQRENYYKNRKRYNEKCRLNYPIYAWECKVQIIFVYTNGKMCCDICGNEDIDVLSVDHINDGGHKARKNGEHTYTKLIQNNFPEGYRILCRNCNWKEHLNGKNII